MKIMILFQFLKISRTRNWNTEKFYFLKILEIENFKIWKKTSRGSRFFFSFWNFQCHTPPICPVISDISVTLFWHFIQKIHIFVQEPFVITLYCFFSEINTVEYFSQCVSIIKLSIYGTKVDKIITWRFSTHLMHCASRDSFVPRPQKSTFFTLTFNHHDVCILWYIIQR